MITWLIHGLFNTAAVMAAFYGGMKIEQANGAYRAGASEWHLGNAGIVLMAIAVGLALIPPMVRIIALPPVNKPKI